jgi:hypothetical protein
MEICIRLMSKKKKRAKYSRVPLIFTSTVAENWSCKWAKEGKLQAVIKLFKGWGMESQIPWMTVQCSDKSWFNP